MVPGINTSGEGTKEEHQPLWEHNRKRSCVWKQWNNQSKYETPELKIKWLKSNEIQSALVFRPAANKGLRAVLAAFSAIMVPVKLID